MHTLTTDEIEVFASQPHAKRVVVENFLSTLTGSRYNDVVNLNQGVNIYRWNCGTVQAIQKGIDAAYRGAK